MLRSFLAAAAGAVILTAPVHAQAHQHGAQADGAKAEMKCAMHADHAADPAHRLMPEMLLKHDAMLKFSDAQKAQLAELQAKHRENCSRTHTAVAEAEQTAAKLLEAETPDLARYESLLREAAQRKVDCKVDMARTGQAAKALLTPAQREHLSHMSGHAGH